MIAFCKYESPLGTLVLAADEQGLCRVGLHAQPGPEMTQKDTPVLAAARTQLDEYFAGRRTAFDLPISETGTGFQKQVWAALRAIPWGETRSYGQIAAAVGRPAAARAVGGACHANPLLIVTPCHRVVGSGGALTGFGAGLPAKEFLLALEHPEPSRP